MITGFKYTSGELEMNPGSKPVVAINRTLGMLRHLVLEETITADDNGQRIGWFVQPTGSLSRYLEEVSGGVYRMGTISTHLSYLTRAGFLEPDPQGAGTRTSGSLRWVMLDVDFEE